MKGLVVLLIGIVAVTNAASPFELLLNEEWNLFKVRIDLDTLLAKRHVISMTLNGHHMNIE